MIVSYIRFCTVRNRSGSLLLKKRRFGLIARKQGKEPLINELEGKIRNHAVQPSHSTDEKTKAQKSSVICPNQPVSSLLAQAAEHSSVPQPPRPLPPALSHSSLPSQALQRALLCSVACLQISVEGSWCSSQSLGSESKPSQQLDSV